MGEKTLQDVIDEHHKEMGLVKQDKRKVNLKELAGPIGFLLLVGVTAIVTGIFLGTYEMPWYG